MSKILVGKWDCKSCGTKGIDGESYQCPNCGTRRPPDVKFYLDNSDTREANDKNENPDWSCQYCGYLNTDSSNECIGCGHTREESDKNYFEMNQRQTQQNNTQNSTSSQHPQSRRSHTQYTYPHTQYRHAHQNHKHTNSKQIIKTAMFIMPILVLLLAMVYNLFFKEVKATVVDKLWQTSVSTETYKEVMEEDWHIPQGGTEIFRRKEIHHYEQKQDGYKTETYTEREFSHNETYTVTKDLGNGKFKQETKTRPAYRTVTKTRSVPKYVEVPVYRTKYTYSIWRWEPNTNLLKKGNYTSIIEFEDFKEIEGKQRIVNKSTDYSIECKADKKSDTKNIGVSESQWNSIKIGQEVVIKGNKLKED